ncbi:hypothetical protein [Streptomyces europaeiscabiei]|uniref:hypothetical protein n=1 Tax=Streptomyces europaeiscabiei TaxID=146819 RepID=UPI0029AAC378|nr:hypothetical protein [Streptomyces europaeiscabiei]MDX3838179.1 hypothetical protein [Streptomyces europaeiscabiei]
MIDCPSEETLPPGPLRELTLALRALYRDADYPSLRKIQEHMKEADAPATASHERIRQILAGQSNGVKWAIVESIVRALAFKATPQRDIDGEVARIRALWRELTEGAQGGGPTQKLLPSSAVVENADRELSHPIPNLVEEIPAEIKKAAALSAVAELTGCVKRFVSDGDRDSATLLIKAVGRLRGPQELIRLVVDMRKASLHPEVLVMLQEAVASMPMHELIDLVLHFYKEEWSLDALIAAMAVLRTPQEVAGIVLCMDGRKESDELTRKFAQLRDAAEVAELEESLLNPFAPLDPFDPER